MGFVAFFFVGSDKGENEAMESCKYQPLRSAEYRNLFGQFGIKVQEKKTRRVFDVFNCSWQTDPAVLS